ncbi:Protein of unknown function [Bacillus thuringiensis]|uniref:Uncharacterized protein n=1 Tax=Bacillus thuringiensis TaxID=1428 RepID=A0A1C4GGQ5_BACTU|nr:Protein of unknown function [Bacillus thuringiensis]
MDLQGTSVNFVMSLY